MSFSILGTGSALPERVVTNEELSHMVDTSDAWIRTRTGIRERRVCSSETVTELACQAAAKALTDSGCTAAELDLIICATISADYATPSMACILQDKLGAHCPAFDINAACTGFLYALDIAAGYFARKGYAMTLDQANLTPDTLFDSIHDLYDRRLSFISAMSGDATADGTDEVLDVIRSESEGSKR